MSELNFRDAQTSSRKALFHLLLWTAFFNGLVASLISIPIILQNLTDDASIPALIYLALQQFGHFQFFAFLASLTILPVVLLFPHRSFVQILLVAVFTIFVLLVFLDYAVFRLYRFHLNGMVWNMLTGDALREIFVFDLDNFISAGILIGSILAGQILLQYGLQKRARNNHKGVGWRVFFLVFLLQLGGQSMIAWADAWYKTDILSMLRFAPLAQPITIKAFLRKNQLGPDIRDRQVIKSKPSGHFQYPLEPLQCDNDKPRYNLLFIIVDSLRFDMLTPEIMPNWTALAQKSHRFSQHISTGNATRFGIFGLFSGLYGNYWFDALNTETGSALIEVLQQEDYRFGFFANGPLRSPEFDKTVFSNIRVEVPLSTPGKSVIEREYEINRQAIDFLQQKSEQPFFGLLFYDAPHAYVSPPQDQKFLPALEKLNYLDLDNDSDPLPFLNRYKNSVHFDDRLSGEIFETLRQQGLMENTIIILTGDHGQEANETHTNSWGHNSNFSRYQVQVPLLLYWPGQTPAEWTHLSSHMDIVPTLLTSLFSCQNPVQDYSNGRSLFDNSPRNFVPVKSWNFQAIINQRQVRVFPEVGPTNSYTFRNYQKIDNDNFTVDDAEKLIEEISRFTR